MAKFFKKKKKPFFKKGPHGPRTAKSTEKVELVDPVLYIGGLDKEVYPTLPLENEKKDKKPEEEIENPLNKR
ncbi:hypothetical protein HON36_00930 [Candidatus Parcubacteria bacterium]|nr:hypothetical protein [Candidatus Parcubacteria bacterium]MBT7228784.1 hypothetical protein [Candidatus Parcubacteria bacterium]